MTVWRYGPSKYGLTVDAVNDGQTVILEFGNCHDGAWRYGWRYGPKFAKRPKNGIFTPKWPFLNVTCVLFVQTKYFCKKERKRKGKRIAKSLCLDQDYFQPWSQLFIAIKHWRWFYTVIMVDGPLDRLDGRHRHFRNTVIFTSEGADRQPYRN